MEAIRRWAEHVVDTTNYSSNDLQQEIRQRFADAEDDEPALNIVSFGFARGLPRHAALVFDMRYLRTPHWDAKMGPGTGLDADVSAPIAADPAYAATLTPLEALLLALLPRSRAQGKGNEIGSRSGRARGGQNE